MTPNQTPETPAERKAMMTDDFYTSVDETMGAAMEAVSDKAHVGYLATLMLNQLIGNEVEGDYPVQVDEVNLYDDEVVVHLFAPDVPKDMMTGYLAQLKGNRLRPLNDMCNPSDIEEGENVNDDALPSLAICEVTDCGLGGEYQLTIHTHSSDEGLYYCQRKSALLSAELMAIRNLSPEDFNTPAK